MTLLDLVVHGPEAGLPTEPDFAFLLQAADLQEVNRARAVSKPDLLCGEIHSRSQA